MKKLQEGAKVERLSVRASVLTTAAVAACAFLPFAAFADAKLPLIVWGTLPESEATAARYAEAKEAGFTHVVQWCASADAAKRILGEAEKAGVKLVIGLHDIKRMADEAEAFTAACKDSPALEYYYIADEPHKRAFDGIRDCVARYETRDPAHACYVRARLGNRPQGRHPRQARRLFGHLLARSR